jgi:hypothetical protein
LIVATNYCGVGIFLISFDPILKPESGSPKPESLPLAARSALSIINLDQIDQKD